MYGKTATNNSAPIFKSNPLNPSSINSPRLSGARPHLDHGVRTAKRFKPNLGGCRIRPFPEDGKEEFVRGEVVHGHCKEFVDGGRSEGVLEEGDPEEGAPVRVSFNKTFINQSLEASSNASTLASPVTSSFEPPEVISELDLAQDTLEGATLTEVELRKLLEKLKQEKGFTCIDYSQSPILTFKCSGEHTFFANCLEEITCSKCEIIIAKCSQYAKLRNGNLFIKFFRETK